MAADGAVGLGDDRLAFDLHRPQVVDVAHALGGGLAEAGQVVQDVESHLAPDQRAGRPQRGGGRGFGAPLFDRRVEERVGAPVGGHLAGEAARRPRHVERPDPGDRREVAHRDVGDAGREAGGVDPLLDVVSGPVGGVDHEVVAGDRRRDRRLAIHPLGDRRQPDRRVERRKPFRRNLDLEAADVGLGVEGLPVEVAPLDPVAVDQQHLADPAAGQRPGGPAAEPADPEDDDARGFEARLALRRRRPRGDVAEVADLAIETGEHRLRHQVVVGSVLEQPQLPELGEEVADRLLAEALLEFRHPAAPVEGGEQQPPLLVGLLDLDVGAGAGPQQVEVALGRFHLLGRSLDSRSDHGAPVAGHVPRPADHSV
ncbi:MAG TPA: hypothetical protein VF770_01925 [Solirubrobacterales bacterium]